MALGGALGLCLVARDAAALCVAGAAHTRIYRRFAWQAWHRLTSIIVLRGRRGTDSHLPSFCVAAMALLALGGALGLGLVFRDAAALCVASAAQSTVVLRGRRGTNSHLPSFCVAGVALMALGGALGLGLVARGAAALCVAGAAQTHIYRRFPWQA